METAISKLTIARRALIEARSLNDVLSVGDMASAIRAYAKASGESLEIQNAASDLRLSAERKAGGLLAEMELHNGDPRSQDVTRLDDIGITKMQSSRWQLAAKLPASDYAEIVSHCNATGKELTQAAILRAARIHEFGETEPSNPSASGNGNLIDLISMARKAIASLVDAFGESNVATLMGVLRDELETLEGNSNGDN